MRQALGLGGQAYSRAHGKMIAVVDPVRGLAEEGNPRCAQHIINSEQREFTVIGRTQAISALFETIFEAA